MAKVGDKFVIEIEEVLLGKQPRYRMKGFSTLIFDENGIAKIKPFDVNEAYEAGYRAGVASMMALQEPKIDRDKALKVLKDYKAMSKDDENQTDYEAFSWAIRELEREIPF